MALLELASADSSSVATSQLRSQATHSSVLGNARSVLCCEHLMTRAATDAKRRVRYLTYNDR